jgi:hypothetical protein
VGTGTGSGYLLLPKPCLPSLIDGAFPGNASFFPSCGRCGDSPEMEGTNDTRVPSRFCPKWTWEFHRCPDIAGAFRAIHNFKFHPPSRPPNPSSPWLNPLRDLAVSPLTSPSSPGPTRIRPAQCLVSSACGHPRPSEPGIMPGFSRASLSTTTPSPRLGRSSLIQGHQGPRAFELVIPHLPPLPGPSGHQPTSWASPTRFFGPLRQQRRSRLSHLSPTPALTKHTSGDGGGPIPTLSPARLPASSHMCGLPLLTQQLSCPPFTSAVDPGIKARSAKLCLALSMTLGGGGGGAQVRERGVGWVGHSPASANRQQQVQARSNRRRVAVDGVLRAVDYRSTR